MATFFPWPSGDVLALRPELGAQLNDLLGRSAERVPGRLDDLMSARVEQLRGRTPPNEEIGALAQRWSDHTDMTPGERAVMELTERFVLDVRSVDDATYAAVRAHYDDDEVAAISFRLALLEGMSKFATLFSEV